MARTQKIRPGATLTQSYELPAQKLPIDRPVVQYIRQSSKKQLKQNPFSTNDQDVGMKDRLLAYKWKPALILPAIDTDTGKSGTKGRDQRAGLTRYIDLIETDSVGAVAALNVSRIYRSVSKSAI